MQISSRNRNTLETKARRNSVYLPLSFSFWFQLVVSRGNVSEYGTYICMNIRVEQNEVKCGRFFGGGNSEIRVKLRSLCVWLMWHVWRLFVFALRWRETQCAECLSFNANDWLCPGISSGKHRSWLQHTKRREEAIGRTCTRHLNSIFEGVNNFPFISQLNITKNPTLTNTHTHREIADDHQKPRHDVVVCVRTVSCLPTILYEVWGCWYMWIDLLGARLWCGAADARSVLLLLMCDGGPADDGGDAVYACVVGQQH